MGEIDGTGGREFPLECPACSGDIRLVALITEPGPIRTILTHVGEPASLQAPDAARGSPALVTRVRGDFHGSFSAATVGHEALQ